MNNTSLSLLVVLTDLFTKRNTKEIAQTVQSLPAWNMRLTISGPLFEFCFIYFHVFMASVHGINIPPISSLITFQRLTCV